MTNGPEPLSVASVARQAAISAMAVVPRKPKRKALQSKRGMAMKLSGSPWVQPSSHPSNATAQVITNNSNSPPASASRLVSNLGHRFTLQTRKNGATSRAPIMSPNHQVSQNSPPPPLGTNPAG